MSPKPAKLIFLTSTLDPKAQAEGFITDWTESLSRHCHHLIVIVLIDSPYRPINSNITIHSLATYSTKPAKLFHLFRLIFTLNRQAPITGIFTHMYDFLGASAGIIGKILHIKTIYWYAWGLNLNRWTMAHLALKLVDEIVTCSTTLADSLRRTYRLTQPIHVLNHAIDPARFSQPPKSKPKTFTIGFTGRVIPEKNLPFLIQALSQVAKSHPLRLHLALAAVNSHPAEYRRIRRLLHQAPFRSKVILNLPYQHIPKFLHSLHLYIHPSLVHSIDKSGIEPIFARTPVLLSSWGYSNLPRITKPDLFDPKDPSDLISKLTHVITHHPQFARRQSALQNSVISQFSTDRFMHSISRLFTTNKSPTTKLL